MSVSRTYVPNEYVVWLSPRGPRALRGRRARGHRRARAPTCSSTRAASASRWSRARRSSSAPTTRCTLGEFGIQARLVARPRRRRRRPGAGRPRPHDGLLDVGRASQEELAERAPTRAGRAILVGRGQAPGDRARRRGDRPQPRVRRRARRLQRLAPPRRDPARRAAAVDGRRPRLDQRRAGQRPRACRGAAPLKRRRPRRRSGPSTRASRSSDAGTGLRRAQVRLPGRAVPVPAVGLAQRAEGPAPRRDQRAATAAAQAAARRRDRPAPRRPTPPAAHDGPSRGSSSSARPGTPPGMEYDIGEGAVMGRGDQAEIRLEDPFASSRHARLVRQGGDRRDRGPRLDERDLPQRGARSPARSRCTPATGCASATASSPTMDAADAARRRARRAHRHRAPAQAPTRTRTSRARRCSRSPTGWAGRRPARSRRGVAIEVARAAGCPTGAAAPRSAWPGWCSRPTRASTSSRAATSERRGWARRSPPPTSARTRSRSPTSATAALYRLRDGALERLTEDHTLVEELVRQGKLTPEEAERAPAAVDHHARAGPRARRRRPTRTRSRRAPATCT